MPPADDLITPDTVSIELVRDLYDQAFMDVTLDEERKTLRLKEEVVARVFLSESRERLQMLAIYGLKDDAQRVDRLELVNRINETFVMVRAGIDDDGDLWFDYSFVLKGGVTRKAVVQATKMFLWLVPRAVNECDEDSIID